MASDDFGIIDKVIRSFKRSEWLTFVRKTLLLDSIDIEECEQDYHLDGIMEQRRQMVITWQKRNGNRASVDRLEELVRIFREPQNAQLQNQPQLSPSDDAQLQEPVQQMHSGVGLESRREPAGSYSLIGGRNDEQGDNGNLSGNLHHVPFEKLAVVAVTEVEIKSSGMGLYGGEALIAQDDGRWPRTKPKLERTFYVDPSDDAVYCNKVKKVEITPMDSKKYDEILKKRGVYNMTTNPKGLALILNNNFEGTGKERKGSRIDVKNMVALWSEFGCKLYEHKKYPKPWENDKTAAEMKYLLEKVSKVTEKYSFIVIVIMSRGMKKGEHLVFEGSDDQTVEVEEIEKMFHNTKNANLHDIPKFFIFQFCRGNTTDEGVSTDCSNEEIHSDMKKFVGQPANTVQIDGAGVLPSACDMLVAYATQDGNTALRDENEGSWFINAITNVFMHQAKEEHVVDMLTVVNRAMKKKTAWQEEEDADGRVKERAMKAMSDVKFNLSNKFYLFPGFPK